MTPTFPRFGASGKPGAVHSFVHPDPKNLPANVQSLLRLRNSMFRVAPFLWEATMAIPERVYFDETNGFDPKWTLAEGPMLVADNDLGTRVSRVDGALILSSSRRMAVAAQNGKSHWWGGNNAGHQNKHTVVGPVDVDDKAIFQQLKEGTLGEQLAFLRHRYPAGGILDATLGVTDATDRELIRDAIAHSMRKILQFEGLSRYADLFWKSIRQIQVKDEVRFGDFIEAYGGTYVPPDFNARSLSPELGISQQIGLARIGNGQDLSQQTNVLA